MQDLTDHTSNLAIDWYVVDSYYGVIQTINFMWFSDEKLFSIAVPVNTQRDRVFAHPTACRKRDINATRLIKTRSNFTKSAMVSIALSSLGASNSRVLEPAVKINVAYYGDVVLTMTVTMMCISHLR